MTIRFAAPAVLAAITAFALAPVAHADDLMYRVGSDISPGDYTYTVVGGDLGSTASGDEGKPALAFSRKRHALIAPSAAPASSRCRKRSIRGVAEKPLQGLWPRGAMA